MENEMTYNVYKSEQTIKIDGDWDKQAWNNILPVSIINYMGRVPAFKPGVQAKMMYDDSNLFVIFQVRDRYVRCITNVINGPVWEDGAVEFFFSPDHNMPERYFNLEVNCGGTPLMHYNIVPDENVRKLDASDIKMIEIAHSLPQIIDPEITEEITWTVEYRIPLILPKKYSLVSHPKPGVEWRANFFKIAENSTNPHYITWSPVGNDVPNFHLPEFFGKVKFM